MATVEHAFYFERLYPFQDEVLQMIAGLDTGLYLTGGTAASRGYLHHRFSDDIDLFANDNSDFQLWIARVVSALASAYGEKLAILQRDERFVRLAVTRSDVTLKIELINDVPAHIGPVVYDAVLGRLDSAENILANKITALIGRDEPKDLADIWGFCCVMGLPLARAIRDAESKAAGIFPADLARILCSATDRDWALIRWIDAPPAARFVADLYLLGEQLLLIQ